MTTAAYLRLQIYGGRFVFVSNPPNTKGYEAYRATGSRYRWPVRSAGKTTGAGAQVPTETVESWPTKVVKEDGVFMAATSRHTIGTPYASWARLNYPTPSHEGRIFFFYTNLYETIKPRRYLTTPLKRRIKDYISSKGNRNDQ
jgi:hypothetical protein